MVACTEEVVPADLFIDLPQNLECGCLCARARVCVCVCDCLGCAGGKVISHVSLIPQQGLS